MGRRKKWALLLGAVGWLVLATSHAGVIRDQRGNAVEPPTPAAATVLVPTGRGWGQRPVVRSAAAGNQDPGNSTTISPFISLAPGGKERGKPSDTSGAVSKGANGIDYHGGPLMLGETNLYFIWYGNWGGNTALNILADFAESLGGSPYYNINTTYRDGSNVNPSNSVSLAGASVDNYSRGSALDDADLKMIVSRAIGSGALPAETNAVYFVLTSADVNETSGFCTRHCGWHARGTIDGRNLKYVFVGNPDRCPGACATQTIGPNGNAGADAMASTIAHELAKTVTDPELSAWYDRRGRENADKCAWTFGSTYTTANGARANMRLGSRDYLIQQNWVNAKGGYCALSYP